MPIGLSDILAPLGVFPILEDINLKGGYQTVSDTAARNAINTANRKAGMLVYTSTTAQLWVLAAGLTNSDWALYPTPAHASTHLPGGTDALTTAAPAQGIGAGNSAGTATSFSRSDHDHKLRTTTGPTDLTLAGIVDGEFLKRSGTTITSGPVVVSVAKLYPVVLNATTVLLTTEVVVGGIYFDPALFTSPIVSLRIVGNFTATTGSSTASLYLYDMGPGTGAFSPLRRSTVTIPFANVGQQVKVDQVLTLSASPGVDANQIHTTARVYELRMYLNTADVGATMSVAWGGLSVV